MRDINRELIYDCVSNRNELLSKNTILMVKGSENIYLNNNKVLAKPITLGNYLYNIVKEGIHQVIVNPVRNYNINKTYVDENYQILVS